MSYLDDFARLRVLEDEVEEVTKRLVARASEWYRVESGRTGPKGKVLDPTAGQFATPVPYAQGKGKGFLTAQPSARARVVMGRAISS